MNTVVQSIKQSLTALLPANPAQIDNILGDVAGKDDLYLRHLDDVLRAEATQAYFEPGHYEGTCPQKDYFDYEKSTEFARLLGMVFGQQGSYANLPVLPERISRNCTAEHIASMLDRDGYFIFPERLGDAFLDTIINGLKPVSFAMNGSHKIFKVDSPHALASVPDNTCWPVNQQEILSIPQVQQLIMDPVLLDAIERFLGCPPIHVQSNSWWSKPNGDDSESLDRSAQMYHQDKEFIKFIKVFIYLNDVTEENGPHHYIAGSNKDYFRHAPTGYKVSDRVPDEVLQRNYAPERFKTLVGKKGTIIIEDTSGFHKGQSVKKGYRQILQLEFAASLYFNPVPSFALEGLTPEYREFLAKNARFALNYNTAKYRADLEQNLKNRKKLFWVSTARAIKRKLLKK